MKLLINYLIITFLILGSIYAQDVQQLQSFADKLKSEGEYFRAITEYKRINNYFPQNENYFLNIQEIADCYILGGYKLEAINEYNKILKVDELDKFANFQIAKLLHELAHFYESNEHIFNHIENFNDSFKDTLILMSGINYVYLKDFVNAKNSFEMISATSPLFSTKTLYISYLDTIPIRKNRRIAGALNLLIPGSGYIYTEKFETGIATFVTNTLFATLFYKSIKAGENNSAVISGLVFTGFYVGSVSGAKQSADNWNKLRHKEYALKFTLPKTRSHK